MDKVVVLIMSIIMPQGVPDVQHAAKMDSAEECWDNAKKFAERPLSDDMKAHGAIGLSAGCLFVEKSKEQKEHEQQEKDEQKKQEEREKM